MANDLRLQGHCTAAGAAIATKIPPASLVQQMESRLAEKLRRRGIEVTWQDTDDACDLSVRFVRICQGSQIIRYLLPLLAPAEVEVAGRLVLAESTVVDFHFEESAHCGLLGGSAGHMIASCIESLAYQIAYEIGEKTQRPAVPPPLVPDFLTGWLSRIRGR